MRRTPVRVLLVEDSPSDAELLLYELQQSGFETQSERVFREADYRAALARTPLPDVILADYTMPTFTGPQALRILRELGLDIPFVVVTGTIGEEHAVECVREGAADYLLKDRLTRLGPAVERALDEHALRREKRRTDEALRERLHFEEFLTEHSTRLIHAKLDEMDAAIEAALRAIAEGVGFHRAHIVLFDEARERMTFFAAWSAPGVPGVSTLEASVRDAGWPVTAAASGERVIAERSEIEQRAPAARGFLAGDRLEEIILLPLSIEGSVVGAIGFERHASGFPLPQGLAARLNLAGEMVANALARKRSDEKRLAAFQELASLKQAIEHERDYLREEIQVERGSGIVGSSPGMAHVLELVQAVASTKATVLVHGESGVGKELIARAIHAGSERASGPLVKVNCASIPKELFESEFFGHMRGSFTGAHQNRIGRFELADGGTLFLDEAGEIPLELQAKFLRVLQDSTFERVGDFRTRHVDVRIIAATNRNLAAEAQAGRFRRDLFYRLNVFPIEVPPLRARREDIIPLAEHFLALSCRALGRADLALDAEQKRALERYDWPGNIRELSNVIERAAILSRYGKVNLEAALNLPQEARGVEELGAGVILKEADLRSIERRNLLSALEKAEWRISGARGAAELLGIRPSTLRDRMKALGVQKQT